MGSNVIGNNVSFEYAPQSHTKVTQEQSSNDLDQGYVRIPTSTTVVKSIELTNGLGSTNRTAFEYGTPIFNTRGLGMVGYESILVNNVENGTYTDTYYDYRFPINGRVVSRSSYRTSDDLLLSSTDHTYCFDTTTPLTGCAGGYTGVYAPIQTNTTSRSYELDGTLVSTITSEVTDYDETYGNVITSSQTSVDATTTHTSSTTNNFAAADEDAWWVNKLDNTTSVASVSYTNNQGIVAGTNNSVSTTQTFGWKPNSFRQLDKLTLSASDTALTSTTEFQTYDTYGNATRIVKSGTADPSLAYTDVTADVISEINYDDYAGYFANSEKNGVWLENAITRNYDERFGSVTTQTDVNGLTSTTLYDAFGRPVEVQSNTSPTVYSSTEWCDASCTNNAVFKMTIVSDGQPTIVTETDRKGQTLRTSTQAFAANVASNQSVITTAVFDSQGRMLTQEEAYFGTGSKSTISYSDYDVFNRYTTKVVDSLPQEYTISYDYQGLTTDITVQTPQDGSRFMKRQYNALKQLMGTMDANNNWTYFRYNAAGNPILIKDANSSIISANYDGLGNKLWFDDPNMGRWNFRYNGLGQLRWQQDANLTQVRNEYDGLGRQTEKYVDNQLDSSWVYDSAKKGTIALETRGAHSKEYFYDDKLNLEQSITTIQDGGERIYTTSFAYDGYYNRVKAMQYPSGEIVATTYDQYGYGIADYDPLDAANTYREIKATNARGQIELQQYGNGLYARHEFSASGEHLRVCVNNIQTCGNGALEDIFYSHYDQFGNVKEQWDVVNDLTENFNYDNLHRLTRSTRVAAGSIIPEFRNVINNYDYDNAGNITLKSDYASSYIYTGSGGPNAVSQITKLDGSTANFYYDNNGNLESGDGREITYNHFNKPIEIIKGSVTNTFQYGANQQRYLQRVVKGTKTTTTYYVDMVYEDIVEVDGGTTKQTQRHYLGDYAIINIEDGVRNLSYTHRNRLGSATLITNGDSHVDSTSPQLLIQERRGFDPFGKARDMVWGDTLNGLLASAKTSRGFTDHEHLDDVELIHMNGRAYDYNLGRFLSVDPFISFPKNSQAVNAYSYVMNNPLSGTDPSGYDQNKRTVERTAEAQKKTSKGWVTVADDGSLISPGYSFSSKSSGNNVGDVGKNSGVTGSPTAKNATPNFNTGAGDDDGLPNKTVATGEAPEGGPSATFEPRPSQASVAANPTAGSQPTTTPSIGGGDVVKAVSKSFLKGGPIASAIIGGLTPSKVADATMSQAEYDEREQSAIRLATATATATIEENKNELYGPFHRREAKFQTRIDSILQTITQEVWGSEPTNGQIDPTVQAFYGPLSPNTPGVEFYTRVKPYSGDKGTVNSIANWRQGMPGVLPAKPGFVKIPVYLYKNTQINPFRPEGK